MDIPDKQPLLLDGDYLLDAKELAPAAFGRLAADFAAAGSDAVLVPRPDPALAHAAALALDGKIAVGGVVSRSGIDLIPFGVTTFERLIARYRDQIAVYADAGLSYVCLDGFTAMADLRAALLAARSFGLITVVLMETGEECRTTQHGVDILAALVVAQSMGCAAFGVTAPGAAPVLLEAVERLYPYAAVPLAVRLDAGEPNPVLPGVYDLSPQSFAYETLPLLRAGAQIIGGRRGVTAAHIRALAERITEPSLLAHRPAKADMSGELLTATHRDVFFLPETPEISSPLNCTLDMSEELLEAADTIGIDVISVAVTSVDDAHLLAENAHMATLPVLLRCDDEHALEQALLHYQGRALVDSQSYIPSDRLWEISARYGALVY